MKIDDPDGRPAFTIGDLFDRRVTHAAIASLIRLVLLIGHGHDLLDRPGSLIGGDHFVEIPEVVVIPRGVETILEGVGCAAKFVVITGGIPHMEASARTIELLYLQVRDMLGLIHGDA